MYNDFLKKQRYNIALEPCLHAEATQLLKDNGLSLSTFITMQLIDYLSEHDKLYNVYVVALSYFHWNDMQVTYSNNCYRFWLHDGKNWRNLYRHNNLDYIVNYINTNFILDNDFASQANFIIDEINDYIEDMKEKVESTF